MKRLDCGTSGTTTPSIALEWATLGLPTPWAQVVELLAPGTRPRSIQAKALGELRGLEQRRNLIVAAPTNGGKSLVGLLMLLEAVRRGRRAIMLEPLRAIAREKYDELLPLAPELGRLLDRPVEVRLTTGDYRLDDEFFSQAPPRSGELIIATPERLDAILRNAAHEAWVAAIGAVCLDEAHLIGSTHRGPVQEFLLTSLLCRPEPPRLILLSATIGQPDRLQAWLAPCDVVIEAERNPPLHKEVLALDPGEDPSQASVDWARAVLDDPDSSALIFVYQTRSAEKLAREIHDSIDGAAGPVGPLAYHAQLSMQRRREVREAYASGDCRCVVTTTALALGVNLPATHVLVRDSTFPGVGPLPTAELLQIMGRAGRQNRPGRGSVLLRPEDAWQPSELSSALRDETVLPLTSSFVRSLARLSRSRPPNVAELEPLATAIAGILARSAEEGCRLEDLEVFMRRSLGGSRLAGLLGPGLSWLCDPSRRLAFRDEQGRYRLTVLGRNATKAVLPLPVAAGVGQLFRDLMSLDPEDSLLAGWGLLDHLIVLDLMSGRSPRLRNFSQRLGEQLEGWMEAHPESPSVLFRRWIAGQSGFSRAEEVFGSLGLAPEANGKVVGAEAARRTAYLSVFRSVVLLERGRGQVVADLERRWSVTGFEGVEERWRDDVIWLASSLARALELRCFYHHLVEACGANEGRIRRVRGILRQLRQQLYELQDHLKYCSPLGPVLRGLRRVINPGQGNLAGVQTIRRLEESGIQTLADLAKSTEEDLVRLGIQRRFAAQVLTYVRRRLQ